MPSTCPLFYGIEYIEISYRNIASQNINVKLDRGPVNNNKYLGIGMLTAKFMMDSATVVSCAKIIMRI